MVPVSSDGFGEEYNNAPVNLKLVDWALGHRDLSAWASRFNKNTKLYAKCAKHYAKQSKRAKQDKHGHFKCAN